MSPTTAEYSLLEDLTSFREFGEATRVTTHEQNGLTIPVFTNEFWTSKQRAGSPLHEISYRACFKPQLPRFFIERLTQPGDTVYDPFMGRGTTLIESALLGRCPMGCDINPLSQVLVGPRLNPPTLEEVASRLEQIDLIQPTEIEEDLLVFYHPETLKHLTNLKSYLLNRIEEGTADLIDQWIQMVATNRLTGHSPGFFSVYTLPPNQAVSLDSQRKINAKRKQTPPERDVKAIILKKTKSLLRGVDIPASPGKPGPSSSALLTDTAHETPSIKTNSVDLVITSPPFLDVVNYQADNWLRCWFNGIDATQVPIWQLKNPEAWTMAMTTVFKELKRILKPGGHIAFEVGEVRGGKLKMEDLVIPAAQEANLDPELILINDQDFTKTANCWGVSNSTKGTNTNRVILLRAKM